MVTRASSGPLGTVGLNLPMELLSVNDHTTWLAVLAGLFAFGYLLAASGMFGWVADVRTVAINAVRFDMWCADDRLGHGIAL